MKKTISLILVVTIAITILQSFNNNKVLAAYVVDGGGGSYQRFTDLPSSHYATESVNTLVSRNIINGYPDGTFRPDNPVTIEQFVKLTISALGYTNLPEIGGHWANAYMNKAEEIGLFFDDETKVSVAVDFNLHRTEYIKRKEVAFIIVEAQKIIDKGQINFKASREFIKSQIKDMWSITGMYQESVLHAYDLGLINGFPDDTFRPNERVTRAQSAVILYRLLFEEQRVPIITSIERDVLLSEEEFVKLTQNIISSAENRPYTNTPRDWENELTNNITPMINMIPTNIADSQRQPLIDAIIISEAHKLQAKYRSVYNISNNFISKYITERGFHQSLEPLFTQYPTEDKPTNGLLKAFLEGFSSGFKIGIIQGAMDWGATYNKGTTITQGTSKAGVLDNANFAQKTYRADSFSDEGIQYYSKIAGKDIVSVDDLVGAIKSGEISPSQIPIDYVVRDGNTLILNTRSSQALTQAGIPRSQWNAVNRTGQELYEGLLSGQLTRNKLTSEGISTVRPSNPK